MQGSYAIDTSALIVNYYRGVLEDTLSQSYVNLHILSETFYVICRSEGVDKALKYVQEVAGKARITPSEEIALIAGQFKCKYPISLADAWTLATAKRNGVPALFGVMEREIIDVVEELRKEVKIEFL